MWDLVSCKSLIFGNFGPHSWVIDILHFLLIDFLGFHILVGLFVCFFFALLSESICFPALLFFCNESLGGVGSTTDFIFGGEILMFFEFFGCQILIYKKENRHILSS